MTKALERVHFSSAQIIIAGFATVILLGAALLTLPFASRVPGSANFADALFTATSAVCVTGLVVQDTALYWSEFGQAVILILIQIGGMGVVTVAVAIAMISGKKISLMQRSTMQEAISAHHVGGVVRLTGFIVRGSLLIELVGAMLLGSVLEYAAGFLLEKLFHQKWWDYSDTPHNLHGYICLKFSVVWGLAGALIVRYVMPLAHRLFGQIPRQVGWVLLVVLGSLQNYSTTQAPYIWLYTLP